MSRKTKKASDGGYAPVEPKELDELRDIIDALIELKYESDVDGDRPVEVMLVDRTRYERPFVLPIPYTHSKRPEDGKSELELLQTAAENHMTIAKVASDAAERDLRAMSYIVRDAIKDPTSR